MEVTQAILGSLDSSNAVATKELLAFMTILENSPVLCAYGLERCACLDAAFTLPLCRVSFLLMLDMTQDALHGASLGNLLIYRPLHPYHRVHSSGCLVGQWQARYA